MPTTTRARLAALLTTIAAIAAAIALVLAPPPDPPAPPTTTTPVVTKVDADADGKRDDALTVAPAAAAALDTTLKATTPEGEPVSELAEPLRESPDPSTTPPGVLAGPLAAGEFPGCRTKFVGNYSARGRDIGVIGLHQTVSRANGWASQNALTALANRPSSYVSWHFLVAPVTGLCTYSVPLQMKAWTQGNANPVTIGIEVERYGDEKTYVEGAGKRKLIAILTRLGRDFNIPMQRGKVTFDSKCRPTVVRRGIMEHSEFGSCGGGHADVTPWSITPLIQEAARAQAKHSQAASAQARERGRTCNSLRWQRGKLRALPKPKDRTAKQRTEAAERIARIQALKLRAAKQDLTESKCQS